MRRGDEAGRQHGTVPRGLISAKGRETASIGGGHSPEGTQLLPGGKNLKFLQKGPPTFLEISNRSFCLIELVFSGPLWVDKNY